ncbi:hypothetical protein CRE_24400 [Caenorhabditis remanei]|uniref:G-protein coupled receptors family 1 profile domain-containing protein n=1 Tax=Caenorhabditis remanei TaxID=31234 RepID=E3MFS4_CAERE|nr:hypothetical protein CRE_24400 [Caenorhabditis remanei]
MDCLESKKFSKYGNSTRHFFCFLWEDFTPFAVYGLYENGIYVAIICILINIFHIIVISQKSMSTSPIYILLAAIAVMDICSLLYDVHFEIVNFFKATNICYSKNTDYFILVTKAIMESIRYFTRRCSTWLSLSIALIRTVVIKYPMNRTIEKLSKPVSAIYFIIAVLLLCAPLHILDFYKFDIDVADENYLCKQFPSSNFIYYAINLSMKFQNKDHRLFKIYRTIDALLSKFIPCILFPIVTLILILEIRKAEIRRQKLESSSSSSTSKNSKNTSRLVLSLTLPFFIAELPLGIIFWLSQLDTINKNNELFYIFDGFEKLFSFILSATTATHMIICVFMSSQYRETALIVARFGHHFKKKEGTVVQVTLSS